jgi:catechol 2,3-dioxygenase-like lactoylglutathione lyase family enzyme
MTHPAPAMPPVRRLHHYAMRCRNAEETRRFYQDLLGLKLAIALDIPYYAKPGDVAPFAHLFFEMADGSYLAFFDLGDGKATAPDPQTPNWVNHLALEMDSVEALLAAKTRLEAAGVEVLGPKDHDFCRSIYFFDPNGIRLEFTARVKGRAYLEKLAGEARGILAAWSARHAPPAE